MNGAAPTTPAISLAGSGIDLHSGHIFQLGLQYDGTTEAITLTDTSTNAVWTTSVAEDIPGIIGGNTAYFGFTAGTGAATANADVAKPEAATTSLSTTANILNWNYVNESANVTAAAILTPTTLNFGSITVAHAAVTQTVTLSNPGGGALAITSVGLAGINAADFSITANTCVASLAAGASCAVTLTFNPTATGTRAAQLSIVDQAGTQTASLAGTGISHPFAISPGSFDFGLLTVGLSIDQAFTLTNISSAPANIDLPLIQENGISFEFDSNIFCGTIAPAGTCTLVVRFEPNAAGTFTGTLNIIDSGGTQSVSLAGRAALPTVTLTPATVDFGSDQTATPHTLTVTNNGGAAITITGITPTGSFLNPISFLPEGQGAMCTSGLSLPSRQSCTVQVIFVPQVTGANFGALSISYTNANNPNQTLTLKSTFIGTGTSAENGILSVTPLAVNLGNVPAGTVVETTLVLRNLTDTSFYNGTFGGLNATLGLPFTLVPTLNLGEGGDCLSSLNGGGGTLFLLPHFSCTLTVAVGPVQAGFNSGTLTISGGIYTSGYIPVSVSVPITATIVPNPHPPTVAPKISNLGTTIAGDTSPTQTITLTNPGPLTITVGVLDPSDNILNATSISGPFALASTTCVYYLVPGASCTASVTFSPTATGPATGTFAFNTSVGPVTAELSGTGSPTITATPASYDFGDIPAGTFADKTIVFSNLSDQNLIFTYFTESSEDSPINVGSVGSLSFPMPNGCAPEILSGRFFPAQSSCPIDFHVAPFPQVLGSVSQDFSILGNIDVNIPNFGFVESGSVHVTANIVPNTHPPVVAPTTHNFGTTVVGGNSPTQTFTLTNPSTFGVLITQPEDALGTVTVSGPFTLVAMAFTNNAAFYSQTEGGGKGDLCTATVSFNPAAAGPAAGTLTFYTSVGPITVALSGTGVAPSPETPFIDFGKSFTADALTLSGPTTVTSGALQLTAGPSSAASSAFYPTEVPTSAFTSDFTFQLLDPTAEGITFTIQGDSPTAVGLGGGGLGYQGLAKSLAIKFDLKDTAGEGVDSTGIYINGAAPTIPATSLASSGIDLHSGHVFALHLTYDGTTMSISLTDTVTGAIWTTQAAEDIPAIVGGSTAYFGFTAGSGTPQPYLRRGCGGTA